MSSWIPKEIQNVRANRYSRKLLAENFSQSEIEACFEALKKVNRYLFKIHSSLADGSLGQVLEQTLQERCGFQKHLFLFSSLHIRDTDTFKLILFFLGNGWSQHLITEWILTSQHWTTLQKGIKRARQINFIYSNLDSKASI